MSSTDPLELLTQGAISVKGRMPWSSNVTLLAELALADTTGLAVYKPERGERPLWDFPPGLYKREVAAYRLSEALGWGLVPLTVLRDDGPLGEGSSPTTPTARAATASSAPTTASTPSTTASPSTSSPSCAP